MTDSKLSSTKELWEKAAAERRNPKRKPTHYFTNRGLLDVFRALIAMEAGMRYKVANLAEVLDHYPGSSNLPDDSERLEEQESELDQYLYEVSEYLYEVSEVMKIVYPRAAHAITVNRDYRTVEAIASAMIVVMPAHKVHAWRKHWIDIIKNDQLPASTHDLGSAYDQAVLKTSGMLLQTDTRPADERQNEFMREAAEKLAAKLSANPRPIR
jgi:hypothetical protein